MEIIILIINLFLLESMLSVDNAAVLAILVEDLPGKQKNRALRYGLLGAYIMRGACLLLASWLVKLVWLKVLGGMYLLWLGFAHFVMTDKEAEISKRENGIFKWAESLGLSRFWATVIIVEIMDLAFSIDNVFAAVAFSDKIWAVMIGVAIGMLAMRFVAQWFVNLMAKHPTLTNSAYIVIILLGLKLIITTFIPIVSSHLSDLLFSGITILIFFAPLFIKKKPI